MERERLIKYIENRGWTLASSGNKFDLFKPPKELGFEEKYNLPIPKIVSSSDFITTLDKTFELIAEIYEVDIKEIKGEISGYLSTLLKNAMFFKLQSNETMFYKTLEVNEIWNFLKNLSTSYTQYVRINFFKNFGNEFSFDIRRINAAINRFINMSKLRVVALEHQSFCFGVSADTVMGRNEIKIKKISEWRSNLVDEYKQNVIDLDFSSEEVLDSISKRFKDEERRLIYTPIIKNINNSSNYSISLTDRRFNPKRKLERLSEDAIVKIIPKDEKLISESKHEINFIKTVIPIDSTQNIIKLNVEELQQGNLFTQKVDEISGQIEEFTFNQKMNIKFKSPVQFTLVYDPYKSLFVVKVKDSNIEFFLKDFNHLQNEFDIVFSELIGKIKIKSFDKDSESELFQFFKKILPDNFS